MPLLFRHDDLFYRNFIGNSKPAISKYNDAFVKAVFTLRTGINFTFEKYE